MKYFIFLFTIISIIILQSCHQHIANQSSAHTQKSFTSHDTIDFRLTEYNNIIIKGLVNDLDTVDLMFHTDAHYVSLTREALQHTKTIKFTDTTDVKSWGGSGQSEYSDNNTLSLGHLRYDSLRIWSSERSGHYSDGKFGPSVIGSEIFGLNYSEDILVLYSQIPNTSEYSKIPIDNNDGSLYLSANSVINNDTVSQSFLIHTGYSGTLLYDDDFVNAHSLGSSVEITSESELSDSYGNKIKTKKGVLPLLSISDVQINNAPIGFFEGSIGRQKRSVIGAELLKRFDLIFDLSKNILYLKKSKYFNLPFSK